MKTSDMTAEKIIRDIQAHGGQLEVIGDRLRLINSSKVPQDIKKKIRKQKKEIRAVLAGREKKNPYSLSRFIQEGIKKGSALLPCKSEADARALLPEIRAQLPEGRDVTVIHHGKKYLLNIYSWKELPAPPERRQP